MKTIIFLDHAFITPKKEPVTGHYCSYTFFAKVWYSKINTQNILFTQRNSENNVMRKIICIKCVKNACIKKVSKICDLRFTCFLNSDIWNTHKKYHSHMVIILRIFQRISKWMTLLIDFLKIIIWSIRERNSYLVLFKLFMFS